MEANSERSFEEVYAEVADNASMYGSTAFKRLLVFLDGWEQEAYERMLKNHSREMAWEFQQFWKHRKDIVNGIRAWGEAATKQRDEMIEQMKEHLETV